MIEEAQRGADRHAGGHPGALVADALAADGRIRVVDDIGVAQAEVVGWGAEVCPVRHMQDGSDAIVACTGPASRTRSIR